MAHEIESMMYVGIPPWHGLGTSVESEVSSDEALRLAGLDWGVTTTPVLADSATGPRTVPGARAVVRTSDWKPLGVVGERYVPVQNDSAFAFFDSVVGDGQAQYHTAGSLDGGRRIWMLAKLNGLVRVGRDDITEKFVLLTNAHDGSAALRMFLTPVRVVCANTLNLALQRGAREGISIRHTTSAFARIEEAQRALGFASNYFDRFQREADRLSQTRFTDVQMQSLAAYVLPAVDDAPSTRTERAREKVIELFSEGAGHETIRGTAWAALNAVAEFADHHRSRRAASEAQRAENRLKSAWFGSSSRMKQRAHEFLSMALAA